MAREINNYLVLLLNVEVRVELLNFLIQLCARDLSFFLLPFSIRFPKNYVFVCKG